jgi:hypothetical protein
MEILKQCYESLEKTLDNTEKEKEQYQVIAFLYFKLKLDNCRFGSIYRFNFKSQ